MRKTGSLSRFSPRHPIILLVTSSCPDPPEKTFQGYVEGEFVYVAFPIAGRLETLNVHRSQPVKKGSSQIIRQQEKGRRIATTT